MQGPHLIPQWIPLNALNAMELPGAIREGAGGRRALLSTR